jgi:hypothetical protein
VQIPAGEFRSQIATLSQQPGMGYLNELAARSDLNWQPVKLAHVKWDFKQYLKTKSRYGSQLLQGTYVSYGTGASFQTRVGEKARADARIILEGIKNSVLEQRTKDANYVVWQKKIDQGSLRETLVISTYRSH